MSFESFAIAAKHTVSDRGPAYLGPSSIMPKAEAFSPPNTLSLGVDVRAGPSRGGTGAQGGEKPFFGVAPLPHFTVEGTTAAPRSPDPWKQNPSDSAVDTRERVFEGLCGIVHPPKTLSAVKRLKEEGRKRAEEQRLEFRQTFAQVGEWMDEVEGDIDDAMRAAQRVYSLARVAKEQIPKIREAWQDILGILESPPESEWSGLQEGLASGAPVESAAYTDE